MKPRSNDSVTRVLSGNRPIGTIMKDVMIILVRPEFWGRDGIPHDAIDDAEFKGVREIWINDTSNGEVWGIGTRDLRNLVCDANAKHIIGKEDVERVMQEDLEGKLGR